MDMLGCWPVDLPGTEQTVLQLSVWHFCYTVETMGLESNAQHPTLSVFLRFLHWIRPSGIQCVPTLQWGECNIRWQHHIYSVFTLFSCGKKIVQSCGHVGQFGLALQGNGCNYLVLIRTSNRDFFFTQCQWYAHASEWTGATSASVLNTMGGKVYSP